MGLRSLGRERPALEDEVKVIRQYLEQFANIPILNGQLVDVIIPNGGIEGRAHHSLGRAYVGAWPVSSNTAGFGDAVSVIEASVARSTLALDPTRDVVIHIATPASSETIFKLWVF